MCSLSIIPQRITSYSRKKNIWILGRYKKFGVWYPKGGYFLLVGYSDADYAGYKVDKKSTSETCQFLGQSLVSWRSKKQNSVALSTAEAEYIAAGACCAQLLWIIQQLHDFGINQKHIPIRCDNMSAINIHTKSGSTLPNKAH